MNVGRHAHGLVKVNDLIYVFGGFVKATNVNETSNSAEYYYLSTDTWKMIDSNMPESIAIVNCAYV